MEILADECVWRDVVEALRAVGFTVTWIHDFAPSADDRDILSLSTSQKLLLVTEDGDFGELVFREGLTAYGIVRVRLSQFEGERQRTAAEVGARIAAIGDRLIGQFTTIEARRTRRRPLPVRLAVGG